MVNLGDYVRSEYVTNDVLNNEKRECTIIDGGEFEEGESLDTGEKYVRLSIVVEFPTHNKYKLRINKKNARLLAEELETNDTTLWVGTRLKLTPKEQGTMKWIEPTILTPPTKT